VVVQQGTGTIHGKIVGAMSGRAIADVQLMITPYPQLFRSDSLGNFSFYGLNARTYKIFATKVGFDQDSMSVDLSQGEVKSIVFLFHSLIPRSLQVLFLPFHGQVEDESGYANPVVVNGVTLAPDRFENPNEATSFDGVDDAITSFCSFISLGGTQRTISVWARGNDAISEMSVVGYGNPTIAGAQFYINYFLQSPPGSTGNGITYDVGSQYYLSGVYFQGQWKHIVAVYGTTSGNSQRSRLYVDGQKVAEGNYSLNTVDSTRTLNIGFGAAANNTKFRYFNGSMDDVRVYAKALSDEEILQLYLEQ